ncbi:hypothetical protein EX30DRAFT_347273 [Ascodesmis nigricans]|uniref:Uncharacterized protein n=1 Tax=Ascodesmis nigricans TaxID=341454 RepID=A0A4V3SJ79_9PEZI|nr:hypothetical protein EX30DRAFT_347273 [Ascodesmis nigricans]
MEYTNHWFNQLSSDDRYQLHVKNIQSLICSIFLTAIPWKSTTVWTREAEIAFREAAYLGSQAAFANSDQAAKSISPNKWDQLFETPVGVSQLDDIRRTDGVSMIGDSEVDASNRKENEAMKVASERLALTGAAIGIVKNESFEAAQGKTWATLKLLADYCAREAKYSHRLQDKLDGYTAREFYEASGILAMSSIEKAMAELASGRLKLGGSSTPAVIDLLALGNLLDISTDKLLAEAAEADQHVANRLLQRAVNFALNEDKTWVTCTSDFMNRENKKVFRCEADTSGPQDCKACLAIPKPQVCYLYQWTRVSVIPLLQNNDEGRNTKPVQFDHWKTRFNINPTDTVISSVLGHDMQSPNYRLLPNELPMTNALNTSFGALSTAAAPGAFTLPICNSRHNFNSHYLDPSTKDYRIDVDFSRHRAYGASKSLPCNCGPWGSETESVWSAAGLNLNDGWLAETCQLDILKKIKSPIERYVALCRINRRGSYIRKTGKAADCDAVINTIDRLGVQEEKEIDPLTRLAIHCQINGNTKGRCRAYRQTWTDLVNKANEWKSQGGKAGADNAEVTKETAELRKEDLVLLQQFELEKDAKEAKGDSGYSHFE